MTALLFAGRRKDMKMVRLLLEKGADVNAQNKSGESLLIWMCRDDADPEDIRFLLSRGADVKVADREGITPLMYAAGSGRGETVRLLLEKGADPNAVSRHGFTALGIAQNPEVRKILKKHGAREQRGGVKNPFVDPRFWRSE
jgi:ankyrin repeat protein